MTRSALEVPIEDFQESQNIMVHAQPGQGKTRWAVGAPNNVLVSSEPGALSAKRAGSRGGLVRINNWSDAVDFRHEVEIGNFAHRTWAVVDTLTTLQQKNLNFQVDKAVSNNPRLDPDVPAQQHYLQQQSSLMRWVEFMIDYPDLNTVWLAHTMDVEDKDGGRMLMPSIQGGQDKGWKVANYVMSLMNAVGYMEMRSVAERDDNGKKIGSKMVRRILWQPYTDPERDIRYIAKDHFDAFGRFTDDLDFAGHLALLGDEAPAKQEQKPKVTTRRRPANLGGKLPV
jgi:hypothetical protein